MTYYILLFSGIILFALTNLKWIKIKKFISNAEFKPSKDKVHFLSFYRKILSEWTSYISNVIIERNNKHIIAPIIYSTLVFISNLYWFHIDNIFVFIFTISSIVFFQLKISRKIHRSHFNNDFPEVLLMINMAASSGASINQVLERCGNEIKGPLGNELNLICRKLNVGESPESVLYDSYKRFNYPEFFFLITIILLNLQQGGQLRELTSRLSSVTTKNKTAEQKKAVMTAQTRMSVNIISLMPILFSLLLYFIDPATMNSMWDHPIGRIIFYYVITSEIVGLVIIRKMLRKTL
ncbi:MULTISPECIES: type II secretion system F family protein [Yersinia]|uniref:type II secretion system F family protein n=1 Tax=Yersinia TaxID=629 RepID=UPI000BFB5A5B|nr:MULTISPECIES: type II secretion system F family protein [Yersinia]ATM87485.1 tight adherance operon protein [Yersinia frederiksenii]MCB5319570.1 type II secretion system F family protein [Yersinia massiliensis]